MNRPIRIGTRGSKLALWQAAELRRCLEQAGFPASIHVVQTTGDRRTDVTLAEIGGKGVFVKELEESLMAETIDVAVHSLKDIPSILPTGLRLRAFLERADPRDAWIHPQHRSIDEMPDGTRVATSAPRRRAQLRSSHPALELRDIRGNVDSRIDKVRSGQYDAAVLAHAGLIRLQREEVVTSLFTLDQLVPAAGQGIIAVEVLEGRSELDEALQAINHAATAEMATCERGILERFGTRLDCHSAVGVHAALEGDQLTVRVFLSDPDGNDPIRVRRTAALSETTGLMDEIADELISGGALTILQKGRH